MTTPNFPNNKSELRAILDGLVEGVITINDKGIILSFNKSAESIFGYTTKNVIGNNISMLMPETDKSKHDGYLEHYVTTDDARIIGIGRDVTAKRKNGESFPLHLSVNEYPAKVDGERWFIGSCLNLSVQKQQEEQLARSTKMEAIGLLTGGISHDFNNLLGVILGYSSMLLDDATNNPRQVKYIEQIMHAAERGAELTRSLLNYSSKKANVKDVININVLLNDNYKMFAKTLTVNIKLKTTLDEHLWPVSVYPGCLEDAILNMSINAMHAMPEGGTLEFTTSNVNVGTMDSQILHIAKGDYIALSISDTGTGMPAEISSQIFTPFFTTKGDKGTGLGLSQVYNFVTNAGGTIKLTSEIGKGSTFIIYLPRHTEESIKSNIKKQQTLDEEYIAIGNILIVDDEVIVRDLEQQILSSKGYTVFCAESGKKALSIIENEKIDLILSDIVMPEMDGYELSHIVHYMNPDIKIQLCSGYPDNRGKTVTDDTLHENLLEKPFTKDQLLQTVRERMLH